MQQEDVARLHGSVPHVIVPGSETARSWESSNRSATEGRARSATASGRLAVFALIVGRARGGDSGRLHAIMAAIPNTTATEPNSTRSQLGKRATVAASQPGRERDPEVVVLWLNKRAR